MIKHAKLAEYRKGLRPVQPESLPAFVDQELVRIADIISGVVRAVQDLDQRVSALEPPA